MNENDLKKFCKIHVHPRDSLKTTDKDFINIDYRIVDGTQWTCFYIKYNKAIHFD